jgi:beta-lactamase regulating signal transducer with metallopeptidase domain
VIATWMTWAILVAGSVGLGAVLLEWAFHAYRRPVRWIWMGAILGIATLSVLPLATHRPEPAADRVADPSPERERTERRHALTVLGTVLATPARWATAVGPHTAALDTRLAMAWCASSLLFATLLLLVHARLWRERATWPVVRVERIPVRISPDVGPAVVGWLRPEIVLPRWALRMSEEDQRLILLHERQHLVAHDQRLLALAILALMLTPWNPLLWWSLKRLRLAIEIDCDRRALGAGAGLRAYGELLIELGSRTRLSLAPVAALAERGTSLVRRVRAFTAAPPRARLARGATAVGMAILVLGAVGTWPTPPAIASTPSGGVNANAVVRVAGDSVIRFVERAPIAESSSAPRPRDPVTRTPNAAPERSSGPSRLNVVRAVAVPAVTATFTAGDSISARATPSNAPSGRLTRGGGRGGRGGAQFLPGTAPDTSFAGAVIRRRAAARGDTATRRPPF